VAKILVADDNSNIQKMVVLALKDQGIEVVAVGNGEAAVRKISDVKPDLVLADIFMPVRNGYEVCKFVKDASALSHIPVILLVGAFDPLDEQEAQRVGADGVLKKPFVPPDPLISMVKSALLRAGVVLGGNAAPPPAPPPIPVATKPEPPPLPRVVPPPAPFVVEPETDLGLPSFPPPQPFTIDKGAQPLAFGSLLESQTPEAAPDDDAVFSLSPTHVAPERDWGSSSAVEDDEVAEETSKHGDWRTTSLPETVDEAPAGQTDWREAAFSGIQKPHSSGWAPSVEKNSLSITEEEAAALARERDALPVNGSRGPEEWAKAIGEVFPGKPQVDEKYPAPETNELEAVPPPPVPEPASATSPEPLKPLTVPAANSWMAGAVSPWDSELPHTNQLASSWDSAKIASAATVEESSATEAFLDSGLLTSSNPTEVEEPPARPHVPEEPAKEVQAEEHVVTETAAETISTIESLLSPAAQELLQEEAAQVVAEQQPQPLDSDSSPHSLQEASAAPAPVSNMDEIVAKVLARMNPDVLQAVTREILKPLVEEMIKDEMHKK
jgi:CheY-like chemotaxis protein